MGTISDHARNRLAVLKAIRRHGPVARSQLPQLCGLSTGLISQLVAEQLERGLLKEQREAGGRPGRPRTLLQTSGRGGIVAFASLAGLGDIRIVFVDLLGEVVHEEVRKLGLAPTLADFAERAAHAIDDAITAAPLPRSTIDRVGIVLPAQVSRDTGSIHYMTMYRADEPVPFAEPISRHLGLRVTLDTDVTAIARGQHWFGAALDLDNFTLVIVDHSITAASYRDGLPATGAFGLNSEFGHVKVAGGDQARPCYCGASGCLAAHASMYGLLEEAGMLADLPFPPLDGIDELFETFLDRAEQDAPGYREALVRSGRTIGTALGNFVNASGPGAMLVAFRSPRFLSAIEQPLRAAFDEAVFPGMRNLADLRIMIADGDWRWQGAAALALEQAYLDG